MSARSVMILSFVVLLAFGLNGARLAFGRPAPFSFKSVEFLAEDQRVAAAQAFVQQNIFPGMSVNAAGAVLHKAGAFCSPPGVGMMRCTHSSMQRPPGYGEEDVTWKVVVDADPTGRVTSAVVTRSVAGE